MDISALYKCFTECGKVTTDSRNCPEGSMFIALKPGSYELLTLQEAIWWQGHNVCEFTLTMNGLYCHIGET